MRMRCAQTDSIRAELLDEARALAARIEAQREQAERLRILAERIDLQTAVDEAALADLKGALGRAGSTVVEAAGSHSIYVSQPQAVAELIETAVSEVKSAVH